MDSGNDHTPPFPLKIPVQQALRVDKLAGCDKCNKQSKGIRVAVAKQVPDLG